MSVLPSRAEQCTIPTVPGRAKRGALRLVVLHLALFGAAGCSSNDEASPAPAAVDAQVVDVVDNPMEDAPGLDDVMNSPSDTDPIALDAAVDATSSDAAPATCATVPCPAGQVCVGSACVTPPSCPDSKERGCAFVSLPGGTFTMGEVGANAATPLQTNITVGPYTLDAHEVTVARFRRFWNAGRPAPTSAMAYQAGSIAWAGTVREPVRTTTMKECNWSSMSGARDAHPMNCLDWWTAQAFCAWDGGRLPTEAEYEWASRGRAVASLPVPRTYPWGNETGSPGCDRAQWNFCPGDDTATTRRVGSFAATPDVFDLAGNVREWMADSYAAYTDTKCWGGIARTNPLCSLGATSLRGYRGGSWCSTTLDTLKVAARYTRSPTSPTDFLGFRCARNR